MKIRCCVVRRTRTPILGWKSVLQPSWILSGSASSLYWQARKNFDSSPLEGFRNPYKIFYIGEKSGQ